MHITVNGEPREVPAETTLLELMRSLGIEPEITAVQRNMDIVDRKSIPSTVLAQDDVVELIRIVGGG